MGIVAGGWTTTRTSTRREDRRRSALRTGRREVREARDKRREGICGASVGRARARRQGILVVDLAKNERRRASRARAGRRRGRRDRRGDRVAQAPRAVLASMKQKHGRARAKLEVTLKRRRPAPSTSWRGGLPRRRTSSRASSCRRALRPPGLGGRDSLAPESTSCIPCRRQRVRDRVLLEVGACSREDGAATRRRSRRVLGEEMGVLGSTAFVKHPPPGLAPPTSSACSTWTWWAPPDNALQVFARRPRRNGPTCSRAPATARASTACTRRRRLRRE